MEKKQGGWINLFKPSGITSAHAVNKIKRILNLKKAGHAGTLDPLADGVLPIAYGSATKEINQLMDAKKEYLFTITFGAQTSTDDTEGEVIAQSDSLPTIEQIKALLPGFTGTIEQMPPQFSALKINGVPAYKLAREGKKVELKPREVTIYSLELETVTSEDDKKVKAATLRACTSKGTYIRSIARDMGIKLGCYGHISTLTRTRVGEFTVDKAETFESLEKR